MFSCVSCFRGSSPVLFIYKLAQEAFYLATFFSQYNLSYNSSTTAACRICSLFWAFQNHRSLRYRTQGVIMLSRARYSWPGSNYPVMLDDCRAGPPPSAASAAEASLPDPRSTRASFLSGVSPLRAPARACRCMPRQTWAPFREHVPRAFSRWLKRAHLTLVHFAVTKTPHFA